MNQTVFPREAVLPVDDGVACPLCGGRGRNLTEAEQLLEQELVADLGHADSNLKAWFHEPERPQIHRSDRHRIANRNGVSFALGIWVILMLPAIVLAHAMPHPAYTTFATLSALVVAVRVWTSEKAIAKAEDRVYAETYDARLEAYERRKAMWDRLVYCPNCDLVIDPVEMRSAPWFKLHRMYSPAQDGVSVL